VKGRTVFNPPQPEGERRSGMFSQLQYLALVDDHDAAADGKYW